MIVTKCSSELVLKIAARLRCSKSPSTIVLPDITVLLWMMKNLWDAFCEIKWLEDDSGVFPFSDLALSDIMKTIIKIMTRIKIDKLEKLRKLKR